MRVKPNHPLAELLAKLLSGIEVVPPAKEQKRMVNRACMEAVKWHKNEISRMKWWIKDMERDLVTNDGVCPECDQRLGEYAGPYYRGCHKEDCDLALALDLLET